MARKRSVKKSTRKGGMYRTSSGPQPTAAESAAAAERRAEAIRAAEAASAAREAARQRADAARMYEHERALHAYNQANARTFVGESAPAPGERRWGGRQSRKGRKGRKHTRRH